MTNDDWVQKGLIAFVGGSCALLVSYVTTISDHKEKMAELTIQVKNLQSMMAECKDGHYTVRDSERDFALINHQIEENARHIKELERLLREHMDVDE